LFGPLNHAFTAQDELKITAGVVATDTDAATSAGGAEFKAVQLIVDNNTDVQLPPRCGKNTADVLLAAKIKISESKDVSVKDNPAEKFRLEKDIKVLGRIPFEHELGLLNSNVHIAVRESEKYQALFSDL